MNFEEIVLRKYTAENGYVFKKKDSDQILSEVLYLGINDSIENYEEILKPIENE